MSYNGSGTFNINTAGQPVVTGTVISTTAFNALTADLGTGLSTAITKDGQTTATARIPFAAGINSSLVTDATNTTTGSIITAGGVGIAKALFVGTTANIAGTTTLAGVTATSITDSGLTSGRVTYAGTGGLLQDSANLTFSGSALAVTGTLSASSSSNGYLSQTFENTSAGSSAVSRIQIGNNASSGSGQVLVYGSNHSTLPNVMDVNNAQNAALRLLSNNAVVASITSTGLAVTGTLSATGTLSGGTSGTGYSFSGSAAAGSLTLDSSGNLGLGVTPSASGAGYKTFQLYDLTSANIAASGYGTNIATNAYLNAGAWTRGGNTYAPTKYTQFNGTHTWSNAAAAGTTITWTDAMTLDASGNLLVGCTATPSGSVSGFEIVKNGATSFYFVTGCTSTAANTVGDFFNPNGRVGGISVSGSATTFSTSSDYRLKENVQPMTGALATVTALKPVTFNWKSDGSDGQGFIAHELQAVVPDCVTGEKDAVNENGSIKPQGIDTSFLVATLTAAIQEQQAIITALTTRITALEAK